MNDRDEASLADLLHRAATARRESRRLLAELALNLKKLAKIERDLADRRAVERKPR